jgi:hypothetical protein
MGKIKCSTKDVASSEIEFEAKGTRLIAESVVYIALYAALTWVLGPISFLAAGMLLSVRLSMALYPLVTHRKYLIIPTGIAVFVGNLVTTVGVWDIVWMPFWCVVISATSYYTAKLFKGILRYIVFSIIQAVGITLAVAVMLKLAFGVPVEIVLATGIPTSLLTTTVIGVPLCSSVDRILSKR